MVYSRRLAATSQLQVKLRAAPVATLGVVSPDGVAGPHADPLRKRPVLTLLLGQLDLDLERLMRRHGGRSRLHGPASEYLGHVSSRSP